MKQLDYQRQKMHKSYCECVAIDGTTKLPVSITRLRNHLQKNYIKLGVNIIEGYEINVVNARHDLHNSKAELCKLTTYGVLEILRPISLYGFQDFEEKFINSLKIRMNKVIFCSEIPERVFYKMKVNLKNKKFIEYCKSKYQNLDQFITKCKIGILQSHQTSVIVLFESRLGKEETWKCITVLWDFLTQAQNMYCHIVAFTKSAHEFERQSKVLFDILKLPTLSLFDRRHCINFVLDQLNLPRFLLDDLELKKFANQLHGFDAAAIDKLVRNTYGYFGEVTIGRLMEFQDKSTTLKVSSRQTNSNKLRWTDIYGYERVKKVVKKKVHDVFTKADSEKALRKLPNGILFYGPPGCSKTMFVNALATEIGIPLISVRPTDILSKFLGDSELNLRQIFDNALSNAPVILFFDELDALFSAETSSGSQVTSRLQSMMQTFLNEDMRSKVIFIGATNRKENITEALIRAGRIDLKIEIPLPNDLDRIAIIEHSDLFQQRYELTSERNLTKEEITDALMRVTSLRSGAQIVSIITNFIMFHDIDCDNDFVGIPKDANAKIKLSVDELIVKFQMYNNEQMGIQLQINI